MCLCILVVVSPSIDAGGIAGDMTGAEHQAADGICRHVIKAILEDRSGRELARSRFIPIIGPILSIIADVKLLSYEEKF